MATLPIDMSGKAGLVQKYDLNTRMTYLGKPGQMAAGTWNPFVRYGYLSPMNNTLAAVSFDQSLSGMCEVSLYDPINDDFYLADNIQIFRGDTTADLSMTQVVSYGTAHIRDMEAYTVNGVRKMFVAYTNSGNNAQIAISSFPYDSATDDVTWLTATVSGAFTNGSTGDIAFVPADNGYLYMLMENQVHKIDGTTAGGANGTVTANVLLFPTNFRLVDGIDYKGNMFIGVHQYALDTRTNNPITTSGDLGCGIYIWDRQSVIFGTKDYIPLPGVSQISKVFVAPNGKVRAIVVNSAGVAELREYNGTTFSPIQRLTFGAQPVVRDGLCVLGDMTFWWTKGGELYTHGSVMPGDPEALFRLKTVSVASTNTGALLMASGTSANAPALYINYQDVATQPQTGRLKIFNLTSQIGTETAGIGTIPTPVVDLPVFSKTSNIKMVCFPTSSTGSTVIATIRVYFNRSNTAFQTVSVTQAMASTGEVFIPCAKVGVFAVQVEVDFGTSAAMGNDDFCPTTAYLEYEPIVKMK